ncbi:cytochrome c oxidase subunit II [soil metagenome]
MFQFIIIAGIILILLIFYMIYRVTTLVDIAKGKDPRHKRISSGNKINAGLFLAFFVFGTVLFFWYSIARFDEYVLPVASVHGYDYENIFWITTAITGFVFILTHILLFWFAYRYQYKLGAKALFYPDNIKLEIAWTILPAIVLALLVFTGWRVWTDITDPAPEDAEVVEIMGYQFAWIARYPGRDRQLGSFDFRLIDAENQVGIDFTDRASFDDFIPREIHFPKGKPVLLKIRARDVLHSVFIPHFRLKMDAVPGMPTRFSFTPNKTTQEMRDELGNQEFNYELACTELCGRGHFSMRFIVVVDEPEDYQAWVSSQQSWLSQNPDYLSNVPVELRELAMISAGITENEESDEFLKTNTSN